MSKQTKFRQPRAGVRPLIAAFFEANPHEELTKEDMVVKFGASASAVEQALWILKAEGVVERAIVYRAAPPEPDTRVRARLEAA